MSAIVRSAGVAIVLALSALTAAVSAEPAAASTDTFKPLQAVSLHMGAKHAVGYFQIQSGVCQLTLVVGDELKGDELLGTVPARFVAAIEAGKTARFDTGEGRTLQFSCAPGASAMSVEALKQVAYTVPQK